MELDLEWPEPLQHRTGAEERLCKIDVFYDFPWRSRFRDERTQFKNGKSLATLVIARCPQSKTPALRLTARHDVPKGPQQTETFFVFVVNIDEYRAAESNAAVSYLANHLDVDITDIKQLRELADAADPNLVRTFIESALDIGLIADWALDNQERMEQLRELAVDEPANPPTLSEMLSSTSALVTTDLDALAAFLRDANPADLGDVFSRPEVAAHTYAAAPEPFRQAIRADASAHDVIALSHRRAVVERFRLLLTDAEAFNRARQEAAGGPEGVWQKLLEDNPWILGIGLSGQLLTSWNPEKLEQVVSGFSVAGPGKRTDALLRTAGRVKSLVLAEIKHHETALLSGNEYRPGCWAPSFELSGGVAQVQQTVDRAVDEIGKRLPDTDDDGAETGEATWLVRPRSFLIVGQLNELRGQAGVNPAKFRSFELYRRNLYEPEVITFDELLARAEWHVQLAADAVDAVEGDGTS
jgi:Domain of unknown function (DUF4263)